MIDLRIPHALSRALGRPVLVGGLATATVVGFCAPPGAAVGSARGGQVTPARGSEYLLDIGADAMQPYAKIPRELPTHLGYSNVELLHYAGQPQGRCEADAAG